VQWLRPKSAVHRSVEQGPRRRGCDRAGAHSSRAIGAPSVPLRGRIQAKNAWNLLRPARDASLLVWRIFPIFAAPGASPSPILARNAHVFLYVRGSYSPIMLNVTGVTVYGQWHFSKGNRRPDNSLRNCKSHMNKRPVQRRALPGTARRASPGDHQENFAAAPRSPPHADRTQQNRRRKLSTVVVDKSVRSL
jgi:hypothetical protein